MLMTLALSLCLSAIPVRQCTKGYDFVDDSCLIQWCLGTVSGVDLTFCRRTSIVNVGDKHTIKPQ